MTEGNNNAKGLIFNIVLGVAGTALLLLVNDMRQGVNRLDSKMDALGARVDENRTRITVLEENRKQMDKALENQRSIIMELQKLNKAFIP